MSNKVMRYGVLVLAVLMLASLPTMQPAPHPTHAQAPDDAATCEAVVRAAMQQVGSACSTLGNNEICYGNSAVQAFNADLAAIEAFRTSGDRIGITNVSTVSTSAYNPDTNTWGVALMSVQADLPAEADERLTFLLLGGTALFNDTLTQPPPVTCSAINQSNSNINIRSAPTTDSAVLGQVGAAGTLTATGQGPDGWLRVDFDGQTAWVAEQFFRVECASTSLPTVTADDQVLNNPMQVLRLTTGDSMCESAPSGLLVQSPEGQQTTIIVNGVEMVFASAGYIRATEDGALDVTGIEGEIRVRAERGNPSRNFAEFLAALDTLDQDGVAEAGVLRDTVRGNLAGPATPDITTSVAPPGASADGAETEMNEAPDVLPSIAETAAGPDTQDPAVIEPGPIERIITPGLTSRVEISASGRILNITPPEIAPNLGILPALLDVAVNGAAFDEAILQSTGDITQVEELVNRLQCGIGQILTTELPFPETDIDPVLGITFPAGDQGVVLVSRRGQNTLQINCLASGTQVVVINVAVENGERRTLGIIVEVSATPPRDTEAPQIDDDAAPDSPQDIEQQADTPTADTDTDTDDSQEEQGEE